jgi:hypothetical protein
VSTPTWPKLLVNVEHWRHRLKKWWQGAKPSRQSLNLFFTFVIAASTFVAALQLFEMHNATIVSQRAWIGVSRPVELDALSLDQKGAKASYVVTIKNYGPSVALHVGLSTRVVVNSVEIFPARQLVCKEAAGMTNGLTYIVGAGFTAERGLGESLFPLDEEETRLTNQAIDHSELPQNGPVFVIGCIVYRDQFGHQRRTRFTDMYYGDFKSSPFPLLLNPFMGLNDAD